jgi:hypothetical protein
MKEITLGATSASPGTRPRLYSVGLLLQLFPYQVECLVESSGSCTCYAYTSGITLNIE